MNLNRLAFKNIGNNPFGSWIVFFCSVLMSGFIIGAMMIVRGGEESLNQVLERLGADIMVIPAGNQASVENALLMGVPVNSWMPRSVVNEVSAVPGVIIASPQLFLSTMFNASCCSVSNMFMIAFDPATDFTVQPWLKNKLDRNLRLGEAIGGSFVFVPEGQTNIKVYGYGINLVGSLEPTGSGLDHSMFFTTETAFEIARLSPYEAEQALVISPDSISAVLIKTDPNANLMQIASTIESTIPGVKAIESASLFRTERDRVLGMQKSVSALSAIAWLMAILVIGMVTSTAISERRQEIGVLRSLGATRSKVFFSLLFEGELLAFAGGLAGISIAAFAIFLFRDLIMRLTGFPLLLPATRLLLTQGMTILIFTLASVGLATLIPILKITNEEPGTAIKE
jgi:putative ABC transport system permease protein